MEIFNPPAYSLEENAFLVKHLGEAPEVVEMDYPDGKYPVGVNPNAVFPEIERIFRMTQQEEHRGLQWKGVEACKTACKVYLEQMNQWIEDRKNGAPRFPSLYVWDDRGRAMKGAVGADAVVKTYFDDNGDRVPFAINLLTDETHYLPKWIRSAGPTVIPKLLEDKEKGTIQCPICHFTQQYNLDTPSTYNTARGRMAKHLVAARQKPDLHREVYTQEFGSASQS